MKKTLLTISAMALLAMQSQATIILNETFSYADGPLTGPSSVSSGAWVTHSGSITGQVQVVSGAAIITQVDSEDISTAVTNATFSIPFTTETLFVSFNVNFSTIPTGSGTYFAHFRDATTGFRCRLFANATGAASGKYRLGLANFSTLSTNLTTDLDPSTVYKVVLRFVGSTNATLWINPTSESSIVNRADGTDTTSNTYNGTRYFSLRQGANNQGICTIDDLLIGTQFSDVQTVGGPPSISGLVNVSIPANSNTGPLPFLISDVETPAVSLTVVATSDNPTLVPNNPASFVFGGAGGNRTLTVTPAAGQQGTANIAVVVTDGNSETATNSFTITVGLPTITSVPNQIAPANSTSGPLVITVNDNETAPASLAFTATSSDQAVLPDGNIAIQVSGGNRTLYLTNIAAGVSTITLTVNDGTFNVSTNFVLTAYPDNGLLLSDDFSYTDGSIVANSSPLWTTHSASTGQTGQTQVINGKLFLTNSASEDINRFYTNAPVLSTGGQLIYTRMVVNFFALPTASGVGEYFTHVYAFSGNYRARVFASTNGAAPGTFRLAISSSSFTPTVFPQDLSLNQSYVVIYRYNTATAEATLWVSPASESSPSVSSTDISSTITAYGVAFRQSTGIGTMSIDDLVVGSTFPEVFTSVAPAPISLGIQKVANDVVLTWSNPQFKLQSAPLVTGTYTNVTGATSPYTNAANATQKYFRLIYP